MSALLSVIQSRVTYIFLLLLFTVSFFSAPHTVRASELPTGVIEQNTCGAHTVDIYSYGPGLMYSATPITVSSKAVVYRDLNDGCAVVKWNTSIPATSQVLVAPLADEPVSIDVSSESLGYPIVTTQSNEGDVNHIAIITGLDPAESYSYRLVNRPHPTALPTISDAASLPTATIVTVAPTIPPVITQNPTSDPIVPATPHYDWEKFPILSEDTTTESTLPEVTETETTGTTTEENNEPPSAVGAVEEAFSDSQESAFFGSIMEFLKRLIPGKERLSLDSGIGLFQKDKIIVPMVLFLALFAFLQYFIFPAVGVTLKNPLLYWLFGSVLLTIISAMFMLYYITLFAIALFLAVLAWYLLKSTPDDDTAVIAEPKLLESQEQKDTKK